MCSGSFHVSEAEYGLISAGSNAMNIESITNGIYNVNLIGGGVSRGSGTLTFASYQNIYIDSPLTVEPSSTFNNSTFNVATFNGQIIVPESGGLVTSQGLATLVSGSVTVFNENVASSSRIYLTIQNINGSTVGIQYISNIVPGVSFDILSTSSNDNSTVAWLIIQTSNV